MQPVIEEIRRRRLDFLFVLTGQHYDWNMSNSFIQELRLPKPDAFLNVRSGSQGAQIARIIAKSEALLEEGKVDVVLVEGDTNSAFGVSLAAARLKIPVGHVEAGCRSFDKTMPEELNRILIADLATLHFAPTNTCVRNLRLEGIPKNRIYCVGHPIVDLIDHIADKTNKEIIGKFNLEPKDYYLVTLHREENTESKSVLKEMLETLSQLSQSRTIFFPVHPRTRKCIARFALGNYLRNIRTSVPASYVELLSLIRFARITLTDSGGVQQETALLGTPCITLRNNTEWVETIECGVNFLARSKESVLTVVARLEREFEENIRNISLAKGIFGMPGVSARIVDIVEEF